MSKIRRVNCRYQMPEALTVPCAAHVGTIVILWYPQKDWFQDSPPTKIRSSSPLHKMQYLHVTYAPLPIYFKSSLEYLDYL